MNIKPARTANKAETVIYRLPPHSLEAEQGILGCCLLEPAVLNEVLIKVGKFGPEVFYDLRHRTIYEAMIDMQAKGEAIDLITFQQRLKDKQQLEAVGGLSYISSLPDTVPAASNLPHYIGIALEQYRRRKLIQVFSELNGQVYDNAPSEEVLQQVEKEIGQLGNQDFDEITIKELVNRAILVFEQQIEAPKGVSGLSTGFIDLDKLTRGLKGGDYFVIAGRPSTGKTSLAMNIAEHVAIELQQPVGIFSLEMTADSLVQRMICSRARVNSRNLMDGFMSERDYPKIGGAAIKIGSAKLHIDDTSGLTISQLRARARSMFQRWGIKLYVIDYLQLLAGGGGRHENRQQEITLISAGIKSMAKELKVPVIVLSQLNREMERDKNRRPRLADLRESGSIENDADLIGLLYEPNKEEEQESDSRQISLCIAKQRNGPTGDVYLTFFRSYTRFELAAKISPDDIPDQTPMNYAYKD